MTVYAPVQDPPDGAPDSPNIYFRAAITCTDKNDQPACTHYYYLNLVLEYGSISTIRTRVRRVPGYASIREYGSISASVCAVMQLTAAV